MVGIRTDLTGAASDIFQAAVKERQLDLRGNKERTKATHKYQTKEAEEDAKMAPHMANTPVQVGDALDSIGKQGPEKASSAPPRLTYMKKESTAATQKFYSKEADQEVKNTFAKAYASMQAVDAQYVTEEQGPKLITPVPEKPTTIKALSTGKIASEFPSLKYEINMAEPLEKTDKMKGQNHENRADEHKQSDESSQIQEVKISIYDNGMIDIDTHFQEIIGAGPDSKYITLPGHLEEYIYKNFHRTPFKFIYSWRKRLFEEMHILPPPRMQISGDCTYNSIVALMECHFKVMFAGRPVGRCRLFNVRLSAPHLKWMVAQYYKSAAGTELKLKDLLNTCLLMAKRQGVVCEADFIAGCAPKASAVRYKIKSFNKLTEKEKLDIPTRLERAEMVVTSFRVTDTYRRILPHEIYRYVPPEVLPDVHPAHCVVLTSSGLEYNDLEGVTDGDEVPDPEVFYEYLNSYNGWGVDGSGYIYADSIRQSYVIRVAEPTHM